MILSQLQVSLLLSGLALLSSCLVNGIYTPEQVDDYAKLCNATEEDCNVIKNYNVPSTETGKSFIKCMSEDFGLLDPDGKYSKYNTSEMIKKYFPESKLDVNTIIVDICYNESLNITLLTEPGTLEYHYKVWLCLHTQLALKGLLPLT